MNIVLYNSVTNHLNFITEKETAEKTYIEAMKLADKGNFEPLACLIRKELTTF